VRKTVGHLTKGVAIYGAGDAAVQVVNLLLFAVYVKGGFLVEEDYGALALILAVEMIAKIVSRWGLDGAFMRFYHDRPTGGPLERMTSTIVWFTVAADVVVFTAALAASGVVGSRMFPDTDYVTGLRLMLVNTFLISLTYIPFHLMRLRNEAASYSALAFARSVGTVGLRVAFVIGMGWGLIGWFVADLVVTLAVLPVLWRWCRGIIRAEFSREDLRAALTFGLPRLPHGLAQQALDAGNKLLLKTFIPLGQLGVYQNGFTLGAGVRFFTAAFETAWAPFYYATARQPDAPAVFGKITTYGIAVLTLIVALTVAIAHDAVLLILTPDYLEAARVIPFIATGMALQGVYLMTSIGLNLTSHTKYYPMATFAALIVGLSSGAVLMPRFGITGAAMAFLASAVTQTLVAFALSRSVYPIPYETGRLTRVLAAGAIAAAAGVLMVPMGSALWSLVVRASITVAVFAGLLMATGFLRRSELAFLKEMSGRVRQRAASPREAE
jgi:O-antigen/teichoic acid export membrane protein